VKRVAARLCRAPTTADAAISGACRCSSRPGDRIAMRARLWMPEKTTDALIQLRADDVLELARLVVQFGIFDGKSILK